MTTRAARRQAIETQILDVGRDQLTSVGAAALSLRAVARELGMVSSAIYRYVESRDELLTRLLVEAYDDLGDQVAATVTGADSTPRSRLNALARGFRGWGVAHPAQYALLYGSPVPGYHAPSERTVEPGTRVMRMMLDVLSDAAADGSLAVPAAPTELGAGLRVDLAQVRGEVDVELSDDELVFALAIWTWLVGAVGQEVFGGLGSDTFAAPAALFDAQLAQLLASTFA